MLERLSVLRIVTSLIFIISGLGHILRPDKILSQLGKNFISDLVLKFPYVSELVQLSGIPLLVFGILLVFNKWLRLSAGILFLMTVGISISTHLGLDSIGPLLKNFVILASLYTLYQNSRK